MRSINSGAIRRFGGICVCLLALWLSGCGYRTASANRLGSGISSVAVVPLENLTTTFEVEQLMTRALVRTFVQKSPMKVLGNPDLADAVVTGAISGVRTSPVTYGTGSFGSTYLVTLTASLEVVDRRSGKVIFKNDRFIFREQYVLNTQLDDFFSEVNPALDRVAEDFASSVVTSILEGF